MARPFPTTFEQDSRMSPQSGGSTPISYQANVNRQKTKKWTDAKPVDYGGDDWGDDDEYAYDEPPPPVPKPTGLRQQGHTLQSASQTSSPVADNGKKNYGDLPSLPPSETARPRNNSFDAGDEKRSFSSSATPTSPQHAAAGPATRFSQITGLPSTRNASGPPSLSISTQPDGQFQTGMRHPSQVASPASEQPYKDTVPSGRADSLGNSSMTSPLSDTRTPSIDFQARRDYSPTAVPAPLSTRSPIVQPTSDAPASRFPARKSSLSQVTPPNIAEITGPPQETAAQKPWTGGRDASPGPRTESPSAPAPAPTAKPLPFIRPADIYRRAEEERRQSLESGGRPSLDALMGSRPGERTESPGKPSLREETSPDSLGGRRRTSAEGDDIYGANRHLMPMLEPVKERKSEYGFEGFDVKDHGPKDDVAASTVPGQKLSDSDSAQLDVQDARRQSTSPKLPDLNRISGFGMDMFTNPSVSQPIPTQPTAVDEAPVQQPETASTELPRQPSTGLRSVVNQAFERIDDSSVPPTPTSGDSNVKRADSDSTGGISPIMRHGPGASPPEPSLNEILEEHVGPTSTTVPDRGASTEHSAGTIPGFKQGYRRDLSAPDSDNSPARTPDVAKAEYFPSGQQAVVAEQSADLQDEASVPTRPSAHTDDSFRPNLPGGWTSYAGSARTETPQPEGTRTPASHIRDQNDEDNNDITPTTTKSALPRSVLGAAAGAAFGGGAALGRHDKDSPLASPAPSVPKPNYNNDSLSTPDPTMAPGGNLYSAASVDPRLLPKQQQAPPINEPRPDIAHRSVSGDSSDVPPPPLPKDTPDLQSTAEKDGVFPSSNVQRKKSIDSWEEDGPESPIKQHDTPAGLRDNKLEEDENEKLEEEIVRRLSPQPRESQALDSSLLAAQPSDTARESTYLPTEYGDYWASTAEDAPETTPGDGQDKRESLAHTAEAPVGEAQRLSRADSEGTPIAPLAVQRSEQPLEDEERPPLKQRFSWEQSTENVSNLAGQEGAYSEEKQLNEGPVPAARESVPEATPVTENLHTDLHDEKIPLSQENTSSPRGSSEEHHTGRNAAIIGGAAVLATGGVAAATVGHQTSQPERRLSLADEKATRVSSYPVSATPPEDEHPARSPQPYFQSTTDYPPSAVSPAISPLATQPQQFTGRLLAFKEIAAIQSPYQRIQTFDETRQRFAAMDSGLKDWMSTLQAQHPEHANVTGSWANSGPGAAAGPSRSKPGKSGPSQPLQQPYYQQYLNASSPTSPSTPTTKPGPSAPAAYQQQGFSPAGPSKITTQQVQAKGKEFLHTAGVFGGKAGKAGKGLLAKGKNKLRGGGGDKTSPAPPPSKNDRRSSWGFPLALSKSAGRSNSSMNVSKESAPGLKPTNDNQPSAATSVQSFPSQLPPTLSAEPSGTSGDTPSPNTQTPHVPSPSPLSSPLPPTLPPIETQASSNDDFTTSVREIRDADQSTTESESHDESEKRDSVEDKLRVPAPIGKYQPSWDPFNATPIAEEQGSAYDTHPNAKSYPFPSAAASAAAAAAADNPVKLSVSSDAAEKSDRSNSVDAHFHDAVEEQVDIKSDWVMVDSQPKDADVTVPPEAGIARDADVTPPSMMHRPRGSSYGTPALLTSSEVSNSPGKAAAVPVNSAPATSGGPDAFVAGPEYQREDPDHPDLARGEPQSTGDSSFLPPIRRISTFGFKLGSRHAKQRFPIEDDDDEVAGIPPVPTESPSTPHAAVAANEKAPARVSSDENRTITRRDSQPEGPSSLRQQFAGHVSQESTETLRQEQDLQGQDRPRRPSLVQASSSEYSQVSTDQPVDRTYQVPGFQTVRPGMSQGQASRSRQSSVERSVNTQQLPQEQNLPPASSSSAQGQYLVDSQNRMSPQRGPEANVESPQPARLPQSEDFRTSQQAWRPNAVAPPQSSPPKQNAPISYMPRQSWEAQRPRAPSGSSQGFMQRPNDPYIDRSQWIPQQSRGFEQPPSSAQRYPDLFKTEQSDMDAYDKETGTGSDMPPQYYQPPLPREAVFLPRQQTNEYQLPGVGPPADEPPRGSPRRNSSFFKEVGGRISRATSRERGKSFSRNDDVASPRRRSESRGNDYADSINNSEDIAEQRKRRSSFFRVGSRGSTNALNPPHSQESMVAHHAGSRTDLMMSSQPSPLSTPQERKRSFFGGSSSASPSGKPKKLTRASTSGLVEPSAAKKKRFSGLSGFFGKPSQAQSPVLDRPQATRELSYNERQPLESPFIDSRTPSRQQTPLRQSDLNRPQSQNSPAPSQARYSNTPPQAQINRPPPQVQSSRSSSQGPRAALAKLTTNLEPSHPAPQEVRPRKTSKTRRSSGAGLLGGLMGRRRSSQQEEKSEDSRSQGSSQPQAPQFVPLAQTYTDLQQQEYQQATDPRRQSAEQFQPTLPQERGRQTSREPQYDSVPIPGGYSLVRGQGAQVVNTDYDPRGLRSQQVDPRFVQRNDPSPGSEWVRPHQQENFPQQSYPQQQSYGQQNPRSLQPLQHVALQSHNQKARHTPPNLTTLDTYQNFQLRQGGKLSVEDLLARSPARSPEGQQRPYQLSLPEDNEDREYPVRGNRSSLSPSSPTARSPLSIATSQPQLKAQHDAIQRLSRNTPQLRHPESPAGYPLPDDVVFSPINPSADGLPPPPPPKDTPQQGFKQILSQKSYLNTMDLNRSSTHRTAVSALSGVSDHAQYQNHGSDSSNNNTFLREDSGRIASSSHRAGSDGDRHVSSPSPTPPSPAGTPDPNNHQGIRTTVVEADRRSSLDIYDASPMNAPRPPDHGSNGTTAQRETNRRFAELEGTKADGFQMKIGRDRGQEEKIFYDAESGMRRVPSDRDDGYNQGNVAMSATSYPGQEWNPYAYDDDDGR